jgi:tetratricopeptide (TPR) repeat protein
MAASIFISHSHSDWRLAERLQNLLKEVSGNRLEIARSSEKGAIKFGESWRDWIDDKVLKCDVAIVLLTPASVRGRWVLWEAGAVAGVQLLGTKDGKLPHAASERRVRVVHFNFDGQDLGPLASLQVCKGLDTKALVKFVTQLLRDFQAELGDEGTEGLVNLKEAAQQFVAEATKALRYTPIEVSEGLVQHWLKRLEDAHARQDDAWILAARRWINIAFLGAGSADAHEEDDAIDFRLHLSIAAAHRRLKDWPGVIQQLKLAASLSPNDLVLLRELGRAYRELKDQSALGALLQQMLELDPDVFKKDREAIALRCGYLLDLANFVDLRDLLKAADQNLVARDAYLQFWRSFSVMRLDGAQASEPHFRQLGQLLAKGKGFWDDANLVNAQLALGDFAAATQLLEKFVDYAPSQDEVASATRYYDDILKHFGREFAWRAVLPARMRG